MFIDGYLALATAVGTGSITEVNAVGYARQPIGFNTAVNGICYNVGPYSFGQALRAGQVGRAIFDAPVGGNLLLVLPFPTPLASSRLAWDSGDPGFLGLQFSGMQSLARGDSYTGRIAAGAAAGVCWDSLDVINQNDLSQSLGNPRPLIITAPMTAGVALSINRGTLQASVTVPIGTE